MKVLTVVGARPQFIKAAPVTSALGRAGHRQVLVHTGQHYDYGMSQVFFDELGIPSPDINLNVGSGNHGAQTGRMLIGIEEVLLDEKPDCVLVYGDTNSTVAGALAACKLCIPLAHVEAGMRSFNRQMPEEHNRVLTDHCSDLLLCSTRSAAENLAREGIVQGVRVVGDTMYDAVLQYAALARQRSTILDRLGLEAKGYLLATVHRAYNTDSIDSLRGIFSAFRELDAPVVFPVHPRTRSRMEQLDGELRSPASDKVLLIEPVGYLDMLVLEENARMILTDSGGMQKEAYFLGVPCITLRPETEWVETVEAGWNVLAGADPNRIIAAAEQHAWPNTAPPKLFGEGDAAVRVAAALESIAAE